MNDRVTIFDTTLRDGEQSPGASMNIVEKVEVARALAELGVDVLEAGFPIASPGDFEAVRVAHHRRRGDRHDRLRPGPVQRPRHRPRLGGGQVRRKAAHPRLPGHLGDPSRAQAEDGEGRDHRACRGQRPPRQEACADVEFSPEDAARTEIDFLCDVVEAAIDAGATTVNIPDTVGYAVPAQYAAVIRTLFEQRAEHRPGGRQRPLPQRPRARRRQQPGRLRGRRPAGRMHDQRHRRARRQRRARRDRHGAEDPARLLRADHRHQDRTALPGSRMVSTITGMAVQRNKAIVGRNAFAHEAGIHQDGMLKDRDDLRDHAPEEVGVPKTDLVLGKHSGRHALRERIAGLGYELNDEQLNRVFEEFKKLCDLKKEVFDADLEAIVTQRINARRWRRRGNSSPSWARPGNACKPSCSLTLRRADGKEFKAAEFGGGPVDAMFHALSKLTGVELRVTDYQIHSVTVGNDALGRSHRASAAGRPFLPQPGGEHRHRHGDRRGVRQRAQPDRQAFERSEATNPSPSALNRLEPLTAPSMTSESTKSRSGPRTRYSGPSNDVPEGRTAAAANRPAAGLPA